MSTNISTCFTYDYQVVRPRLWSGRVLRIKTHLDSKLEHGNVGQLLWKHRISRAILRRCPSENAPKAMGRSYFTHHLRIKTSLAVITNMQTWEAIYGNIVFHVQSCAEVQVKLSPKLFERRVLRIKTHVNSYLDVFYV